MANAIFSWRTNKLENGSFRYTVTMITSLSYINTETGRYTAAELIQEGVMPTRARAKTKALQWKRYFTSKYNEARQNDK